MIMIRDKRILAEAKNGDTVIVIKDEKRLAEALKNGEDTIEIKGDLAKRTFKIKATGKVAWGVCVTSLVVAVTSFMSSYATAGVSVVAGLGFAGASASILGTGATLTAISVAVAAGGVGVLNKLRSYKVEKISEDHIKLMKK